MRSDAQTHLLVTRRDVLVALYLGHRIAPTPAIALEDDIHGRVGPVRARRAVDSWKSSSVKVTVVTFAPIVAVGVDDLDIRYVSVAGCVRCARVAKVKFQIRRDVGPGVEGDLNVLPLVRARREPTRGCAEYLRVRQ